MLKSAPKRGNSMLGRASGQCNLSAVPSASVRSTVVALNACHAPPPLFQFLALCRLWRGSRLRLRLRRTSCEIARRRRGGRTTIPDSRENGAEEEQEEPQPRLQVLSRTPPSRDDDGLTDYASCSFLEQCLLHLHTCVALRFYMPSGPVYFICNLGTK